MKLSAKLSALPRPLRFNRTFAFVSAGLVLGLGLLLAVLNEGAYRAQKLRDVDMQATILAQSVVAPAMFADGTAAQDYLNALGANPQVARAAIFDANGAQLAFFERTPSKAPPPRSVMDAAHFAGQYVEVAKSVERDGRRYGVAYLQVQTDAPLARATRYAAIAILIGMAALVLFVAGAAQGDLSFANAELQSKAGALADSNASLQREMDQRKEAEAQLLQSRKMEAVGQLTGGVAHDFNNLLMVISGGLTLLEKSSGERREKIKAAMSQAVERGAGLTRQLLAFARRQSQSPQAIDVGQKLNGMRELLERSLRADILLDITIPAGLSAIRVDPGEFELAILNLAVNARDAMPKGGILTLTARSRDAGHIEVLVRDTGVGIAADIIDRIFEPYFTTKQVGHGTGLGLSQVYGFMKQSSGEVTIDSAVGAGTTFILTFPITNERPETARPMPQPPLVRTERRSVLVVEDDDAVADTVCEMLITLGHAVTRARNVDEALAAVGKDSGFDFVFTDILMPGGKSGIDLANALEHSAPDLPVLLTSGFSRYESSQLRRPILRKPYLINDLREAIAALPLRQPH